ncbi:DUF6221 family protein [Nocardia sp. NPDC019302]|uniref:DUF6221 family protein n=1 Tax=Nocardia sp. NPDC019302 TaxID=3154592 RepID=UPI0033DF7BE3
MSDIVSFIHARLDEDEGWAREVIAAKENAAERLVLFVRRWLPASFGKKHPDPWPFPGDPERVLLECAAWRSMLEWAESVDNMDEIIEGQFGEAWRGSTPRPSRGDSMRREIAEIWHSHPDYHPEWAPAEEGSQA